MYKIYELTWADGGRYVGQTEQDMGERLMRHNYVFKYGKPESVRVLHKTDHEHYANYLEAKEILAIPEGQRKNRLVPSGQGILARFKRTIPKDLHPLFQKLYARLCVKHDIDVPQRFIDLEPPMKQKEKVFLTDEQKDEIRERYAEGGISTRELAAEYGVGGTYVSRICSDVERPDLKKYKKRKFLTDEQKESLMADRVAGMTYKQLMKKYDVSEATVKKLTVIDGVSVTDRSLQPLPLAGDGTP